MLEELILKGTDKLKHDALKKKKKKRNCLGKVTYKYRYGNEGPEF